MRGRRRTGVEGARKSATTAVAAQLPWVLRVETVRRANCRRVAGPARRHHELVHIEVPQLCDLTVLLVNHVDRRRCLEKCLNVCGSAARGPHGPGAGLTRLAREPFHETHVDLLGQDLQHRIKPSADAAAGAPATLCKYIEYISAAFCHRCPSSWVRENFSQLTSDDGELLKVWRRKSVDVITHGWTV